MMKPHTVGGLLRDKKKIHVVYVWVWLTDDLGIYIQVSKSEARQFVDAAKEDKLAEVLAYVKGKELFLGDDEVAEGAEAEEDPAGEEEEEEEEDLGEEEEEEEADEEEEEEEEEEPAKVAEAKKRK